MTGKIDFRKTLKHLYTASRTGFDVINVPVMNYLKIDGHGDPNTSSAYADALQTLYPIAYKLKFHSKALGQDYVVPPLEGLWWADDLSSFLTRDKDSWHWTMMIMTPDWLTQSDVDKAIGDIKGPGKVPAVEHLRLEPLLEGQCAQTLHIGPYDDEGPILAFLHDTWLPAEGYVEAGTHHEIYLSDPRRTAAASLRTVLRQPIKAVQSP